MHTINPLFISHGSPDLLLRNHPVLEYWTDYHTSVNPRGIVVVSAHWVRPALTITGAVRLATIHDFGGFPEEMYRLQYPARTAPWLLDRVHESLGNVVVDKRRGLDHGAWIPLMRMFPSGNIPIVQVSLNENDSPANQFQLGLRLAGLAEEGILLLGSGAITHNLHSLVRPGSPPSSWALDFAEWLHQHLVERHLEELLNAFDSAPHSTTAHPTPEHLLPLFVIMGAGWARGKVHRSHESFDYGSLCMSSYEFSY